MGFIHGIQPSLGEDASCPPTFLNTTTHGLYFAHVFFFLCFTHSITKLGSEIPVLFYTHTQHGEAMEQARR